MTQPTRDDVPSYAILVWAWGALVAVGAAALATLLP